MNRAPLVLAATLAAATALAACGSDTATDDTSAAAADGGLGVEEIRLDWATYNPARLVLREQGWLEEAVGDDVSVTWEFSAGSAPANELPRGDVVEPRTDRRGHAGRIG